MVLTRPMHTNMVCVLLHIYIHSNVHAYMQTHTLCSESINRSDEHTNNELEYAIHISSGNARAYAGTETQFEFELLREYNS